MKPKKLIYGVGANDANYVVQRFETIGYIDGKQKRKLVWSCPYYNKWASMLKRCYSLKFQERNPSYRGCTVTDEWLLFSNFKSWMENQDWEGKHLDKDLLFVGNKLYSPNTCVFVTQAVNSFTTDRGAVRGEWLIGVYRNKGTDKFRSKCCNPFTNKREHLGYFSYEQEAHNAWLNRKLELAHLLAAEQTDSRVAKALISRYSKPQIAEYK